MSKVAYVILEDWMDLKGEVETDVIGVATSSEKALELIDEYYGEYELIDLYSPDYPDVDSIRKIKAGEDRYRVSIMILPINKLP